MEIHPSDDIPIRFIPHSVRRELAKFLELQGIGLQGWQKLMEEFGFPAPEITFTSVVAKPPGGTNTELALAELEIKGRTVGELLLALKQIEYCDAHNVLWKSLPEIRRDYERYSREFGVEYRGGDFVQHDAGCPQFRGSITCQGRYDRTQRHHAAQPQHPGPRSAYSYEAQYEQSMSAQASQITPMDTQSTMLAGEYVEEHPIAAADVQLRDLVRSPIESGAGLLSATFSCDRNNNDAKSASRDIKPNKDDLMVAQPEHQNSSFTQSSFPTAGETKENLTAELLPKKEEQKRVNCCNGEYQDHGLGVDVRPRTVTSSLWPPDDRPAGMEVGKPRVSYATPLQTQGEPRPPPQTALQTLHNRHQSSGRKRLKIFVTYVEDDDPHRNRVITLLQFLTTNGFSACVDTCASHGVDTHEEALKRSLNRLKQFGFVLFCISPDYKKAIGGHRNGNNTRKHLNAVAINQTMEEEYHHINKNTPPFTKRRYRSIPVLFKDSNATSRDIPNWLKNCGPVYEWPEHHRHLAFYLSRPESCFDDPLDTKSCITQSVTPC